MSSVRRFGAVHEHDVGTHKLPVNPSERGLVNNEMQESIAIYLRKYKTVVFQAIHVMGLS